MTGRRIMADGPDGYPSGAEELLELADQARKIGAGRPAAVKLAAPAVPKWRASIVGPLLERRCFLCGAGLLEQPSPGPTPPKLPTGKGPR